MVLKENHPSPAAQSASTSPTRGEVKNVPAGLFRRIAAAIYDIFIIFALLLFATSLALLINQGQSLRPYQFLFTFYLIFVVGLFYCWFWTHGGQTIGMQAWKIKVVDLNLHTLTWPRAVKRFIFAFPSVCFFGLGYLSCLFNQKKLSIHDWGSKTQVISCSPHPSSPSFFHHPRCKQTK